MGESDSSGNHRLRTVIAEVGSGYEQLARAVRAVARENGDRHLRTNKSAIAHWVAGAVPAKRTCYYLAEALSRKADRVILPGDIGLPTESDDMLIGLEMSPDPVTAVRRLGRADLERRDFLARAVFSLGALAGPLEYRSETLARGGGARAGKLVGAGEIAAVNHLTAAFAKADEIHGGQMARSALIEYLTTDVITYCSGRFARQADRAAMFEAAAATCYLAGFKSFDSGLNGAAQRYYLQAFQLACESDPAAHAGYILRILAHHSLDVGHPAYCVDLANAAMGRVRGKVDAETESLFWLTLARAYATDNRFDALRALGKAEKAVERARTEQRPGWLVLGGPAEARLTSHTAKTLVTLGDYKAAEAQFARCASCWDPATHRRIHALTLAGLGEAQCAQGKVEQACVTWAQALDEIGAVHSARTRDSLVSVHGHLTSFRRRGVSGLGELDTRLTRTLQGRTPAPGTG